MAKLIMPKFNQNFIPRVKVPTETGDVSNREQPTTDQIRSVVGLASLEEQDRYLGTYTVTEVDPDNPEKTVSRAYHQWDYKAALEEKCEKLTGLEAFGITDGETLMAYPSNDFTKLLINDLFFYINGISKDSGEESEGVLSPKEEPALE
jgi:hypothetical protein